MSDQLGLIFGALADPTRRQVVQTLLAEGSTSVPALTDQLPISRQVVAKHLRVLDEAGLVERVDPRRDRDGSASSTASPRQVRYRLRSGGLRPAADWLHETDRAWERRLARLKRTIEGRTRP